MSYIVLDFETYYDKQYSLRKMTPVEYLLDPRFKVIGCAVIDKAGTDWWPEPLWLDGDELRDYLMRLRQRRVVVQGQLAAPLTVISHNALFDMCILAWKYGVVPDLIVDTLSMARAMVYAFTGSAALDKVADHFNLPPKGTAIKHVSGMNAQAIKDAGLWETYTAYAKHDAWLCEQIYLRLRPDFPQKELDIFDLVTKCAVVPKFQLDADLLALHGAHIEAQKQALLARCGMTNRIALMSNEKFAEALRMLGIDPPMKMSPATGMLTYAFARTDPAMIELAGHEDMRVQALVAARVGHKSTIEQTRTEKLLRIAQLEWPNGTRGWCPIPLRNSGAHTHRLCLVGKTLIFVLRDNRVVCIRLDTLRNSDLVWDGEVFVAHGGLAYAGIKEVIEYDGVIGTPDHRVWTVEHGYCSLAEAKARGYYIARGGVPDPTRIDATVQWFDTLRDQDTVYLQSVQSLNGQSVERSATAKASLVQSLQCKRANGRNEAINEDAGSRRCGKQGSRKTPSNYLARYSYGTAWSSHAGKGTFSQVAERQLECSHEDSHRSAAAVPQSEYNEFSSLWGQGDRVPVFIDSHHGRLDTGTFRSARLRNEHRPDRPQWTLRTWQPALGDEAYSIPQQKPTWDIIDCGPRNRFVANGCIVHNSGDWKLNVQNWPRYTLYEGEEKQTGLLRRAHKAPPGRSVVKRDASQIEARITAWLPGQGSLVQAFREGRDIYSEFAEKAIYHYPVDKTTVDERFVGKTAILGLGYGVGPDKFAREVAAKSYANLGHKIELPVTQAGNIVTAYRTLYPAIPFAWRALQNYIPAMARDRDFRMRFGPVILEYRSILLPNGLRLFYHDLQYDDQKREWMFKYGRMPKKIYGGKLFENVVQALARIITMNAALRMKQLFPKIGLAHQVHDDLVYIVPDDMVAEFDHALAKCMNEPPSWAFGLPLASEGGVGPNYGDAK